MFLRFYYILLDLLQDFLLLNHFLLYQSMILSNREIYLKSTFFRIFLCLDLILWYVRILHIFAAYEKLGPKLIMILNTVCI